MNPARPPLDFFVNDAAVVYSLPLFYDRLNQVINHPRSSVTEITKIIAEDTGFSTQILRLANSPLFGYYAKIDSIAAAVTIIGTQQLRDMALAISVIGVFSGIPDGILNMTSFWQHSITCGVVARVLATCRREPNVERFFLAGMLHDIGQLVMCTRAPELVREMIGLSRERGESHYSVQRTLLGYDHGDVGGELLRQWKIPAIIAEPVACHHAPGRAEQYPMEASLLHVADVIGHALQIGFGGEPFVPNMEEGAWERLNLPLGLLVTVLEQSDLQLTDALSVVLKK